MWKESGYVVTRHAASNIFCRTAEDDMSTFLTETTIRNGYTDREKPDSNILITSSNCHLRVSGDFVQVRFVFAPDILRPADPDPFPEPRKPSEKLRTDRYGDAHMKPIVTVFPDHDISTKAIYICINGIFMALLAS